MRGNLDQIRRPLHPSRKRVTSTQKHVTSTQKHVISTQKHVISITSTAARFTPTQGRHLNRNRTPKLTKEPLIKSGSVKGTALAVPQVA